MTLVEAAVESLHSALAAERSGARRIELGVNLDEGGTTPPIELTSAVAAGTRIPLFVLVRPRPGDFAYSGAEIDAMLRDLGTALAIGVDGIVTGALTADNRIDADTTQSLIESAEGLPLTFHRAFDLVPNRSQALEELIRLGVTRILTSGGAPAALQGADVIAELVEQAGERITIVAGGGIREENVREVIATTHVREVHSRLIDEVAMRGLVELVAAET